jgi:hypothetical protein
MLADINAENVFTTGLHEFLTEFLDAVDALNVALQTDYFESYLGTEECVT